MNCDSDLHFSMTWSLQPFRYLLLQNFYYLQSYPHNVICSSETNVCPIVESSENKAINEYILGLIFLSIDNR